LPPSLIKAESEGENLKAQKSFCDLAECHGRADTEVLSLTASLRLEVLIMRSKSSIPLKWEVCTNAAQNDLVMYGFTFPDTLNHWMSGSPIQFTRFLPDLPPALDPACL
jgi:hypothetical protein